MKKDLHLEIFMYALNMLEISDAFLGFSRSVFYLEGGNLVKPLRFKAKQSS